VSGFGNILTWRDSPISYMRFDAGTEFLLHVKRLDFLLSTRWTTAEMRCCFKDFLILEIAFMNCWDMFQCWRIHCLHNFLKSWDWLLWVQRMKKLKNSLR